MDVLPTLNLCHITSNILTVAMFAIVDLQTMLISVIYLGIKSSHA